MLYYVYFANQGVPATGLSLTWEYCITAGATHAAKTGPAFTEIGGGWYSFPITFGTIPWNVTTEDLVGVIDGSATLDNVDRYKPVSITLRGLALAKLSHKGIQTKSTGDTVIYATDGTTADVKLDMTNATTTITRAPAAP